MQHNATKSRHKNPPQTHCLRGKPFGWIVGLEPTASRATIWRASQLRHTHHITIVRSAPDTLRSSAAQAATAYAVPYGRSAIRIAFGDGASRCNKASSREAGPSLLHYVPEGIRTPDPRLRRPLLYPAELRTRNRKCIRYVSG